MAMVVGLGVGYALFGDPTDDVSLPLRTAMLTPVTGQGGAQITAVQFLDADASDGEVEISFQAVKPMRIKGSPDDPAIQKLLAYALVSEQNAGIRIRTVNTLAGNVRREPDPEVRLALVKVLKFDTNPGVRKKALEALARFPMDLYIKDALIFVLENDPTEGLRIDAINALFPQKSDGVPEDQGRCNHEDNLDATLRGRDRLWSLAPEHDAAGGRS
jgi:hypothetical protein